MIFLCKRAFKVQLLTVSWRLKLCCLPNLLDPSGFPDLRFQQLEKNIPLAPGAAFGKVWLLYCSKMLGVEGRNKPGSRSIQILLQKSPGICELSNFQCLFSRCLPASETGRFESWKHNRELGIFNNRITDVCTRKLLFLTCFPSPFFSSASSPGREKHNFQRAHYTTFVLFTPSSLTIFMGVAQHVLKQDWRRYNKVLNR